MNPIISIDGVLLGSKRYSSMANARPVKRVDNFHGLPVSVEIEAGETKGGIGEDGEKWEKTYDIPYGEFPSTRTLADGEGVDVYLGSDESAPMVYVVHQLRRDGSFDEDKVLVNFGSAKEAEEAYRSHGPEWGFGSMDELTVDQFIHGYLASNRRHS